MTTVYPSKIDTWLLVVLVLAMAVTLIGCISVILQAPAGQSSTAWWVSGPTCLIGIGLPVWLLLGTCYTVSPGEIAIKSGPFSSRVPIADITAITETSNAMASPALSLDRLRIDYGRGMSVMISPRDKARFTIEVEALRNSR
ncbi:MAG: PH domain-containing protein [Dokdonella sp.]